MNQTCRGAGGRTSSAEVRRRTNHGCRILVVEDDMAIRHMNTEALRDSGYGVDAARDGADGWRALNASQYDLLITDHKMPEFSGMELLKKLRTAQMGLPVILVSGLMPVEELKLNPWLEINATLQKPYSVAELLGLVKLVLRTCA